MEEWLRAKALATSAIAAIVAGRIDWVTRPQGDTGAAIVLHLISDVPASRMTGPATWHDARVQADCWAANPSAAIQLRRAVVTAFEALRDEANGKKYRTFVIDADGKAERDAAGIDHRAQVDLRISYQV